jgi:predicted MFS family arabinose efflux permease
VLVAAQVASPGQGVTTYRALFANGQFRALFAANAATVAGQTMQMLAVSAQVYALTGSPLLTALAFLGGNLPQAVGAMTLLSFADRVPPRGFLAGWGAVKAGAAALFATGVLSVWMILLVTMACGAVDALNGGVRTAMIVDVVPDGFVLGRSVMNVSVGVMQIVGFAAGGAVVVGLGPARALAVAAALIALSAVVTRVGLRPRAPRGKGRAGVAATWRGNSVLLGSPVTRPLLLSNWISSGLIVGAEAMFVPYAGDAAAILLTAAAAGMLAGDIIVGRWVSSRQRARQISAMQALLAFPYLVFVLHPDIRVAAIVVAVASLGYAGALGLHQRLVDTVPEHLRGQAFGLEGSGRMTCQALGASFVGALASLAGAPAAMTLAAVASLLVTVGFRPAMRVRHEERPSSSGRRGESARP